jgi:hypothetical protein
MVRFLFKCTPEHSVQNICLHAVLYLKISNSEETEIPYLNVFLMRKNLKQNTFQGKQHIMPSLDLQIRIFFRVDEI